MPDGRLYLGTRRYSSWSMRGWLAVRLAGLDVEEIVIPLAAGDAGGTPAVKAASPSGLVPYLEHRGIPARPPQGSLRLTRTFGSSGPDQGGSLLTGKGACLRLCVLAAALGVTSCDDDDGRRLDTVHRIPSPAGSATVTKTYAARHLFYELALLTHVGDGPTASTMLAAEGSRYNPDDKGVLRETGEDHVVVGWTGESHLAVGWPAGDEPPKGPARVGGVEVAYINYEPDLDKITPRRLDRVTLHDVKYTSETVPTGPGFNCTIRVHGTDSTFFSTVTLSLTGAGTTKTREGYGSHAVGGGTMSLGFALAQLPGSRSPALTPTQAKLGDFGPYFFGRLNLPGPVQEDLGLIYAGYGQPKAIQFFHLLHDGGYCIRFNLTFGEQQIEYLIREPISADAAAAYQACEARTYIFTDLVGHFLDQ